jgi:vacuolar-type H+-ATPase subunit H
MNTTSKTFGNGMEATRDALHHAGEQIDEATRDARKSAAEGVRSAATYGREQAGEALDAAENLARSAARYAREKPVQAALIGLGGLLLASLLFRRR